MTIIFERQRATKNDPKEKHSKERIMLTCFIHSPYIHKWYHCVVCVVVVFLLCNPPHTKPKPTKKCFAFTIIYSIYVQSTKHGIVIDATVVCCPFFTKRFLYVSVCVCVCLFFYISCVLRSSVEKRGTSDYWQIVQFSDVLKGCRTSASISIEFRKKVVVLVIVFDFVCRRFAWQLSLVYLFCFPVILCMHNPFTRF